MATTTKTVKGKQYLYYSYYNSDEQKKKEVYCGQSGTQEAKRKALELELVQLRNQRKELIQKINEIETKLAKTS
jgi:hypothetical protein